MKFQTHLTSYKLSGDKDEVASFVADVLNCTELRDIGAVVHKDSIKAQRGQSLDQIYDRALKASPLMQRITKNAELISPVVSETDYSYASERFCGPGMTAKVHLTMTDEYPYAQAIVIIEAI